MSTAPQFGSDARHDWLFVDSSGAARFAHAMFWLGRRTRRGIESARMLLERLRARAARVMHRASIAARAAGALARSVQEHGFADREHSFADRVAPTPARREFARPARSARGWRRAFTRASRRVTLLLVVFVGLPFAYLAYCLATLPPNGGLVIERRARCSSKPTTGRSLPRAARSKATSSHRKMCRRLSGAPSSPSRTVISTSIAASIRPPCCARRCAT